MDNMPPNAMTRAGIRARMVTVVVLLLAVLVAGCSLTSETAGFSADVPGFCGNPVPQEQPRMTGVSSYDVSYPPSKPQGGSGPGSSSGVLDVFRGWVYFPDVVEVLPKVMSVEVYSVPPVVIRNAPNSPGNSKDGNFLLELRDRSGAGVLHERFRVKRYSSELTGSLFEVFVADPPMWDSFAISHNGRELFVGEASVNAPSVEVSGVSEGQVFYSDERIELSLTGADADDDALAYRLNYLFEGERFYRRLIWGQLDSELSVDAGSFLLRERDEVLDSVRLRFAVSVSDGVRSEFVLSPVFEVRNDTRNNTSDSPEPETTTTTVTREQAVDDLVEAVLHQPRGIDVFKNDTGFDRGDYFRVDEDHLRVTAPPKLGTTEIRSWPYRHVGYHNFSSGCDVFEYQVCNEDLVCDTAKVYVNSGLRGCTVLGTQGSDQLVGTAGNDFICGLAGNDTIDGLGGHDIILGGTGNDTIRGGAGDDYIFGEIGNDAIRGGAGEDIILGGAGRDTLHGGSGYDTIGGADSITTLGGNDRIYYTDAPTAPVYEELTDQETELLDGAITKCEEAAASTTQEVIDTPQCNQALTQLCQTTSTLANIAQLSPSQARKATTGFICETADLARRIQQGYPKRQQFFSGASIEQKQIKESLRPLAQEVETHIEPIVQNPSRITEPTLDKLRQLAETITDFADPINPVNLFFYQ